MVRRPLGARGAGMGGGMSVQRAIPTRYRGVLFRSKLEADWARAFDALGVVWRYEPEGRYFGEEFYLLDFYLPDSGQWVEVKATWSPADVRKAMAFCRDAGREGPSRRPALALVECGPQGRFHGWPRLTMDHALELVVLACDHCGAAYFAPERGQWDCPRCAARDEWTLVPRHYRALTPWPYTVREAA